MILFNCKINYERNKEFMKKISKKEWGILGISLGSVLIIVALLTMVGIGSGDTYAAAVVKDCPAGQYFYYDGSGSDGVCKDCPAGFYCPGGRAGKKKCPANATCTPSTFKCNTGYKPNEADTGCDADPSFVTACVAGQYYGGSYGSCKDCPAGFYCPGGLYSASTGDGKIKCPANATCTSSTFDCNIGYKPNTAHTACNPETGADYTKCPAGQYYGGSYGICEDCPPDHYCPGGAFSNSTGNGKIKCPANATCTSSTFDCNIGYKPNTAHTACNPETGADYTKCPAGQYYGGSYGICEDCPPDHYCPGGAFSNSTGNGKIKCPANATCTSSTFDCNRGYEENPSKTACVARGGGNSGGTAGVNGSDGNTSTSSNSSSNNSGNNFSSSNANANPSTGTKSPLVIALIGMISAVLGTFTYFKGKKEQNNEI